MGGTSWRGGFGSSLRTLARTESRRSGERLMARRHLVEHGAKAEDVGPRVEAAAFGLLGRHVAGRAIHVPSSVAARRRSSRRDASDGSSSLARPKSSTLTALVGHHDIGRFQIAMDDASPVRLRQRVGYRDGMASAFAPAGRRRNRRSSVVPGTYSMTMKWVPASPTVVDGDDVRMVEGAGGLGFLEEAPFAIGVGDLVRRQDLDRDEPIGRGSRAL